MGTLNLTDAVSQQTISSSAWNNNNTALKAVVNGGIDDSNINASAAIALSKLAGYPSDATKFARGDGTWATAAPITYRKATAKDVNSTVAATDLLNGEITVAAGALGTTGVLRGTLIGDWLNNTGSQQAPPRLQLLLGGTTLIDTGVPSSGVQNSGTTRWPWQIKFTIANLNSASSQFATMDGFFIVAANAFTGGVGAYGVTGTTAFELMHGGVSAAAAVNTANACALVLNTINPSGSASYSMRLQAALIEVV